MRVLKCDKQPDQPFAYKEEDLVKFDVNYLITCLGKERNTSYKIKQRPDIENRQSPRPDYLVEEYTTGNLIALEHARFFEKEEVRKHEATLIRNLDRQSSAGTAVALPIRFPTPCELGRRLSSFISEKLDKGQFKNFSHAERILLARNRWSGVCVHKFIEAESYFKLPESVDCDHFYLIVSGKLLEVF